MEKSILDVLREKFTPNMEAMLASGEAVPAGGKATKKSPEKPLSCGVCGNPRAVRKGNGEERCAACLTLSAKMPRYSDDARPVIKRGLSPCSSKGGGMGFLVTPESLRLYVREGDAFDLVFLDSVDTVRMASCGFDTVIQHSVADVLALPEGALYFWGFLRESDIYPTLDALQVLSLWRVAQEDLVFHVGVTGRDARTFTERRSSWQAFAEARNGDADAARKLSRKLLSLQSMEEEEARDRKMEKLMQESGGHLPDWVFDMSTTLLEIV